MYLNLPTDDRMGAELKLLGGIYEKLAKRCWKNKTVPPTESYVYVILWLKSGHVKATRIMKKHVEVKKVWEKQAAEAETFTEAMFLQFPSVARMAERFVKCAVEKGARNHEDFAELNIFLWTLAQAEIEKVKAKEVVFDRSRAAARARASNDQRMSDSFSSKS